MRGNKIVLDLEFTPIRDADLQAIASSEILEIGAVKLNEQNEILGEFQTYVRPRYSVIPPYITKSRGFRKKQWHMLPVMKAPCRILSSGWEPRCPVGFIPGAIPTSASCCGKRS